MKRLILAVLLVALFSLTIGCTAALTGLQAISSGREVYKAGAGEKTEKPREYYDAAIHRYYIIDENGRRQYK